MDYIHIDSGWIVARDCEALEDLAEDIGITLNELITATVTFYNTWRGAWEISPRVEVLKGRIRALRLSHYLSLTNIHPVHYMDYLETLLLEGCTGLTRNINSLIGLSKLREIRLDNCFQLKGTLSPLKNHWELQTLDLDGCSSLEGTLSPLRTLSSLQSLNLSHCQFTGSLEPLQSLKSLVTLNLSYCANLHGTLGPLKGLNSLRGVDLRGCWGLSGGIPPVQETSVNSFRVPILRNWQEWRKDDIPSFDSPRQ